MFAHAVHRQYNEALVHVCSERITVPVQAELIDKNKAQIYCSERTSGTGYCKTTRSNSNCARVTDRYRVVFGKLIPRRKKSGRDSQQCRPRLL